MTQFLRIRTWTACSSRLAVRKLVDVRLDVPLALTHWQMVCSNSSWGEHEKPSFLVDDSIRLVSALRIFVPNLLEFLV